MSVKNIHLISFKRLQMKVITKTASASEIVQLHEYLKKACHEFRKINSVEEASILSISCREYLDVLISYYYNATIHTQHSILLHLTVIKDAIRLVSTAVVGEIISTIFDIILDPAQSFWLAFCLVKTLNDILKDYKDDIASRRICIEDMAQFKLMDLIMLCGDYECECSMLELICRLRKDFKDKHIVEGFFPENVDLQQALANLNTDNFEVAARIFLNTINSYGKTVKSVLAEKIVAENRNILPPMEFRNNLWVDFNLKSSGVSLHCTMQCLLSDNVPDSDEPWEHIFIPDSIVKSINIKKRRGFYIMDFNLTDSMLTQLQSSKAFVQKCRNIKFVFQVGPEIDHLIDSFLPQIFNCIQKKKPMPLSTGETPKIVYKPLAIEIRNRSSLGSELTSINSDKQRYIDICSRTVHSRSVVSGKQIRELFDSGEEDNNFNNVENIQPLTTSVNNSAVLRDINQLQKNITEINTFISKEYVKMNSNSNIKTQIKRNAKPKRRCLSLLDSISENAETDYLNKDYEMFKDQLIANSSPISSTSSKNQLTPSTFITCSAELKTANDKNTKDSMELEDRLSGTSIEVSNEPSVILETQSQIFHSHMPNNYDDGVCLRNKSLSELDAFEEFFEEIVCSSGISPRNTNQTKTSKAINKNDLNVKMVGEVEISKITLKENFQTSSDQENKRKTDESRNTKGRNKGEVLKAIDRQSWEKFKEQANLEQKKTNEMYLETITRVDEENAINKQTVNGRDKTIKTKNDLNVQNIENSVDLNNDVHNPKVQLEMQGKTKKSQPSKSKRTKVAELSAVPGVVETNLKHKNEEQQTKGKKEKKKRGRKSTQKVAEANATSNNNSNISSKKNNTKEMNEINLDISSSNNKIKEETNGNSSVEKGNKIILEAEQPNQAIDLNHKKLHIILHDIYAKKSLNETSKSFLDKENDTQNADKIVTDESGLNMNYLGPNLEEKNDKELDSSSQNQKSKIIIKHVYILKSEGKEKVRKSTKEKEKITPNKLSRRKSTKQKAENGTEVSVEYKNNVYFKKKSPHAGAVEEPDNFNLVLAEEIKQRGQNTEASKEGVPTRVETQTEEPNFFTVEAGMKELTPIKKIGRKRGLSLKKRKSSDKLSRESNRSSIKNTVPQFAPLVDAKENDLPTDTIVKESNIDEYQNDDEFEKTQSLHTINYLDMSREDDNISERPTESIFLREKDTIDVDSASHQGDYLDIDNESIATNSKSRWNDSVNSSKMSVMAKTYIDLIKKDEPINKKTNTNLNKSDAIITCDKDVVPKKRNRKLYNPNDTSSLLFQHFQHHKQNISIDTELNTDKELLTHKNNEIQSEKRIECRENKKEQDTLPIEENSYLDEQDVNTSKERNEIKDLKKLYEERVRIEKSINLEYEQDSEFDDEHRDIEELEYLNIPEKKEGSHDLKQLYEKREKYYDDCFDSLLETNGKDPKDVTEDRKHNDKALDTNGNDKGKVTTKRKRLIKKAAEDEKDKFNEEKEVIEDIDAGKDKLNDNELNNISETNNVAEKKKSDDNKLEVNNKRQKINQFMECVKGYEKGVDILLNESSDNLPGKSTDKNVLKTNDKNSRRSTRQVAGNAIMNEVIHKKGENKDVLTVNKNEVEKPQIATENVDDVTDDNNDKNKLEPESLILSENPNINHTKLEKNNKGKLSSAKRKRDSFENKFSSTKKSKRAKETHTADRSNLANSSSEMDNSRAFFDTLFKGKQSNWYNKSYMNSRCTPRSIRRSSRFYKRNDDDEKTPKKISLFKEVQDTKENKTGAKEGYQHIMDYAEQLCVSREIIKTEIIKQKFILKDIFQICRDIANEN